VTPDQSEAYNMHQQGIGKREIARRLGKNESTIRYLIARAERYVQTDPSVQGAMSEVGMQDIGILHSGWVKTDGASLYFQQPKEDNTTNTLDQIKDYFTGLPAIELPPKQPGPSDSDLLTVYPVPDAHIGMRAWAKETGEAYDTDIAVDRIQSGISQCVHASPASSEAIIIALGDLLHANDNTNMTPASKHVLDVDSRHYRNLESAIHAIACAAEMAVQKHDKVTVVIQRGNHDESAYLAVMFALAERYRDDSRINVQKRPGEFFVHQFGLCLLASQHGDKAKAERLVMHLADEWPEMWGATRHRYYFTGHLHHSKMQDIGGVQVEQLRAVTARDAYAASNAYSARAQFQGITYHRNLGEVSRVKVNI